jgi:DNA-binding transcriptional ArsR family regulator
MVEYYANFDEIFYSLADGTRRDMLRRLMDVRELTVGELAKNYHLTFAAISKHLKVLEKARLINKRKAGRTQVVSLNPVTLKSVEEYIRQYEALWAERFDTLDDVLKGL